MPDPSKRIIVDGIDASSFLYFPRILHAVAASLQVPRLLIGLMMALSIATFGKGWDKAFDASISSAGLMAGDFDAEEERRAQEALRGIMRRWALDSDLPAGADQDNWPNLDARDVYDKVQSGYLEERTTTPLEALRERDEQYRLALMRIRELAPKGAYEATMNEVVAGFEDIVHGTLGLDLVRVSNGVMHIAWRTPVEIWRNDKPFTIFFGLFVMIVIATGGGALCRMSACQIAGQERLRIRDAIDFATGNWRRFMVALVLPLMVMALFSLIMMVLGAVGMWSFVGILGGLLYGLALLVGFLIALALIGYGFGFPLFTAAVACENCDGTDSIFRAYTYVINRPLHLIGYFIVAIVGLVLGYVVVSFLAMMGLNITADLVGTWTTNSAMTVAGDATLFDLSAIDPGRIHESGVEGAAAWLIQFWQTVVVNLVVAWVLVYFFSASTWVYLLMRRSADGQDIEEIWRPGLVPGTLTEMPPPVVETAPDDDAGDASDEGEKPE